MARKRLAWAELRVGILVIFSFTILAVAIVLISGGAGFFTEKYELKTYLGSASGLRKGSLVWVAGIEGGNVSTVNITTTRRSSAKIQSQLSAPLDCWATSTSILHGARQPPNARLLAAK